MLGGTWHTNSRLACPSTSSRSYFRNIRQPLKSEAFKYRRLHKPRRAILRPKAADSAEQSDEGMQSDVGDQLLDDKEDTDMLKDRSRSVAATACSQALDGLGKLLSTDEQQSQPLRHRSKALRALSFAGMAFVALTPQSWGHTVILLWCACAKIFGGMHIIYVQDSCAD